PELVDRLVLVASACRLSDRGRSLVERWAADAAEWTENGHDHDHDHDWSAVYTELIDATYDGWRRTAYRTLVGTLGERLIGPPPVPRDVRISMESLASFDACDRLGSISAPTLLVAGDDDVFFDEWTIIDTGEAISNATVYLFEESGHGAFDEHKDAFDRTVRSFLT
ncbi:MAG: alpha/beta fold hydrolase, partial [Halobacteriota archaeon]